MLNEYDKWMRIASGKVAKKERIDSLRARITLIEVWSDGIISEKKVVAPNAICDLAMDDHAIIELCDEKGASTNEWEWDSDQKLHAKLHELTIPIEHVF
jgi:hypothetical protein